VTVLLQAVALVAAAVVDVALAKEGRVLNHGPRRGHSEVVVGGRLVGNEPVEVALCLCRAEDGLGGRGRGRVAASGRGKRVHQGEIHGLLLVFGCFNLKYDSLLAFIHDCIPSAQNRQLRYSTA
jgi:hypothetical protein